MAWELIHGVYVRPDGHGAGYYMVLPGSPEEPAWVPIYNLQTRADLVRRAQEFYNEN